MKALKDKHLTMMIMHKYFFTLALGLFFLTGASVAEAATLRLTPDTGVYTVGNTFTARVLINTSGKAVNAAEGTLTFNSRELSVINVSRTTSIFNLWTQEPSYSNSAGTVTFGGGSPSGYTGSNGTVMSVTFRALNAGTPKVTFSAGSVLAADGLGTNVLTAMTGGTYTIGAQAAEPVPEPVFIPQANTPATPVVASETHPDQSGWYRNTTTKLSWSVPSGVTSMRTLLDGNPGTIPTIVYDTPISEIEIEDLDQGVSYFHIQFRNADGWGAVAHYRLGVDTEKPSRFDISQPETMGPAAPKQKLLFNVEDISPVRRYIIQLDGGEGIEFLDEEETGEYELPSLTPGRHTAIVEAFDSAGNSTISTYAFEIHSFDKPTFTEYPTRFTTEVVPVFRGITRPDSTVTITLTNGTQETKTTTVYSDAEGVFIFIPESAFARGVYDIFAVATDQFGTQSEQSEGIRFVVDEPGYIRFGSIVVSILSIVVPVVGLLVLLVFGMWYLWHRLAVWRRRVIKETKEAENRLALEFDTITGHITNHITKLKKARKGKLTKAETAFISEIKSDIDSARKRIRKEIGDIDDVVK